MAEINCPKFKNKLSIKRQLNYNGQLMILYREQIKGRRNKYVKVQPKLVCGKVVFPLRPVAHILKFYLNKMAYTAKDPRPPPTAFSVPNRNTS